VGEGWGEGKINLLQSIFTFGDAVRVHEGGN